MSGGGELPQISAPAMRALAGAGIERLDQLASITEAELHALHGMGPKAAGILKKAMQAAGIAFRKPA